MAYQDLRAFLTALEAEGELARVTVPVDPILEITEITDRITKAGGPALLFENVTGSDRPLAINLFGSDRRMALALEVASVEEVAARIDGLLDELLKPRAGFLEKLAALPRMKEVGDIFPRSVKTGPCKEVIQTERPTLAGLPIPQCWPQDGGRYITFPLVFTRDLETGVSNIGCYRLQVHDDTTLGFHSHLHKDASRHLRQARERARRIEAAVAIGADPALLFAAICPLPENVPEVALAGFLRRAPVEMVRCETVDLEVPASAEIILEGYVDPEELRTEGPFGDHNGFYSLEDRYPVFHLTAVTHRRDPIYVSTIVGPPPQEDGWLGKGVERCFLPLLRRQWPEIVDVNLPVEGVFHNLMIVAIKKAYPGHARKVMHAIWGTGQMMFTKCIVVVDHDVNVQDPREVVWKVGAAIDPERDVEFVLGPVETLDHASRLPWYGSKMGIDATRKWASEGFTRRWPDEIRMTPEMVEQVTRRWAEYGLPAGPGAEG